MNNIATFSIGAVIGAALGVLVGVNYSKNKYAKIAQEEIDSVKEHFTCPKKPQQERPVEKPTEKVQVPNFAKLAAEEAMRKADIMEYASKIKQYGYTNYSKTATPREAQPEPADEQPTVEPDEDYYNPDQRGTNERPYVITPDEYAENDDYDAITLEYCSDGVLIDSCKEPLDDVDNTIGLSSLKRIGEYEADTVYVRNDQLKCDYEIIVEPRSSKYLYEKAHPQEFVHRKPHEIDDEEE